MTSEVCAGCGARNWTIYRQGRVLVIRCGDCDEIAWDVKILDDPITEAVKTNARLLAADKRREP